MNEIYCNFIDEYIEYIYVYIYIYMRVIFEINP